MTDITVEVGNDQQKRLIARELEVVSTVAASLEPPIRVRRIIVPSSFDDTVNDLQGTTTYRSVRQVGASQVSVQAKVLHQEEGPALVISPRLFTDEHDTQTRMFTYAHELCHFANRREFRASPQLSRADAIYFENLYIFADEHFADRKALGMVRDLGADQSSLLQGMFERDALGYEELLNDPTHPQDLAKYSAALYQHQDIQRFLQDINPIFDALFVVTAHAFALHDSMPQLELLGRIQESPFITPETLRLVEYVRDKYEQNQSDFADGIELARASIRSFGLEFRDENGNLVCHVD